MCLFLIDLHIDCVLKVITPALHVYIAPSSPGGYLPGFYILSSELIRPFRSQVQHNLNYIYIKKVVQMFHYIMSVSDET